MSKLEENVRVFLDALDEWEESGYTEPRPLYCITEGCEGEVMDYDIAWGHYRCPSCGRQVDIGEIEKYVELMHTYEESE